MTGWLSRPLSRITPGECMEGAKKKAWETHKFWDEFSGGETGGDYLSTLALVQKSLQIPADPRSEIRKRP